jgi:hypothetical protein
VCSTCCNVVLEDASCLLSAQLCSRSLATFHLFFKSLCIHAEPHHSPKSLFTTSALLAKTVCACCGSDYCECCWFELQFPGGLLSS